MKKYILFLFSAIMPFLFNSCEEGDVVFYVNDTATTTIRNTLPIALPYNIPIPDVTTTSSKEYENNNTTSDLIKDVSLEKITVNITNPANEDFSFLKEIHIYIKKSDDSDKQELAYLKDINSSATSIDLTTTDVNLVPYLKDSSYKLETEVTLKEYLTHDVDIRIDLKFKVRAGVLKK